MNQYFKEDITYSIMVKLWTTPEMRRAVEYDVSLQSIHDRVNKTSNETRTYRGRQNAMIGAFPKCKLHRLSPIGCS